jgi:hypothetical protein
MVAGLAFLATAIATVFAQATGVRFTRRRKAHERAWTIALALFALASAALATGASTGWDRGTFRAFYLLGAVLCVPWLALGTVYLLAGTKVGHRAETGLILFSGFAVGVMLSAPIHGTIAPDGGIPIGKEHFGVLPRVLAGAASGIGATVVLVGAVWSAVRFARSRAEGTSRLAAGNALIALGTLVLSSGGLVQGAVGKDQAFALTLAAGIAVIYAGFAVASSVARPASVRNARRGTLPAKV